MQLVYRGISYQTTVTDSATSKVIDGKYRGISYQIRKHKVENVATKSIHVLKYRGIDYIKILNCFR